MRLIDADALIAETIAESAKDDAEIVTRWDINNAPTIEAEPVRHGRWNYDGMVWHCSECGRNPTRGMGYTQGRNELYDYCPFCGAKMDGGAYK